MEATALPRGGGRIKLRQSIAKSSAVSCRSVSHSRLARGRSIGAARNSGKTRPEERGLSFWCPDTASISEICWQRGCTLFRGCSKGNEPRFPFTSLSNTDGQSQLAIPRQDTKCRGDMSDQLDRDCIANSGRALWRNKTPIKIV